MLIIIDSPRFNLLYGRLLSSNGIDSAGLLAILAGRPITSVVKYIRLRENLPELILTCYLTATRTGQTSPIRPHVRSILCCGFLWD